MSDLFGIALVGGLCVIAVRVMIRTRRRHVKLPTAPGIDPESMWHVFYAVRRSGTTRTIHYRTGKIQGTEPPTAKDGYSDWICVSTKGFATQREAQIAADQNLRQHQEQLSGALRGKPLDFDPAPLILD